MSDCDANFGVCEAFIGDGNFFYNRADIYSLYDDATIKEWSRRTILGIPSCKSCFAQSICGGGCVSNAIKVFGSIWAPDIYICKSSKLLVKWAFNRWFMDNDIANKLKNKGVYYLSDEERKSILHNLKLTYDIPLQTMSKQNELKNE